MKWQFFSSISWYFKINLDNFGRNMSEHDDQPGSFRGTGALLEWLMQEHMFFVEIIQNDNCKDAEVLFCPELCLKTGHTSIVTRCGKSFDPEYGDD